MSKAYYSGLDGLRFIAAMLVCIFHLGFYSWASFGSTTAEALDHIVSFEPLTPFSWFGWVGVEIFFVISGFVIANSANGASPAAFLRGRLLRLFPAAWICATLTLIAIALFGHDPTRVHFALYARAMTLWPQGPWIDGAYWTLAVEISFYTVVFTMLMFRRFSLLIWGAAALTAASALYTFTHAFLLLKLVPEYNFVHLLDRFADNLLLRHGMFFALGVWFWRMSRGPLRVAEWCGVLLAAAAGCIEIWSRGFEIETLETPASIMQPTVIPIAVWVLAMTVMVAMVRMPLRFTPANKSARDLLRQLGLATYPLYLLQNVFGASILHGLIDFGLPGYIALAVTIPLVLAGAFAVALLVEPAVRTLLQLILAAVWRRATNLRPFGFLFRPSDTI
jgi:peptidoglycan/LPS O-acetylase OafA/YrhL